MAIRALRLGAGAHQGFELAAAGAAGIFINRHGYSRFAADYQPKFALCLLIIPTTVSMGV